MGQVTRVRLTIEPVSPDQTEVEELIAELDELLEPLYPAESSHGFSAERLLEEKVDFFLVRVDGRAAGCGGLLWCDGYAELKRMYARPDYRGQGIGTRLLEHFAELARQKGLKQLRLETGIHQQAAIRLYRSAGFEECQPFGPYRGDPHSLCFARHL